ncbi:3',5'-cyclic-AMP phosphodiesterase [Marinobacter sp.]|uniref:3',5'-cyclic-AMP phosphodiesterase n=1 Tax=Marinobacter sp. TaxID=50741 RepID=UPI00384A59A0
MMPLSSRPPFRVLQLTDPHLMADPSASLLGINTRDSLDAVIGQVKKDGFSPDLILATGDLAQDGSDEAYRIFADRLARFSCPAIWMAGNHDHQANLNRAIAGTSSDRRQILQGGWQFIALNSSVPGHVHGELGADELIFLDTALAEHPELPALVTLHHHPVDIGCDWMADIGLRNREAFWRVIDRWPQVRVVLWGHIHQDLDRERNGVQLLATPSTCIQFEENSRQFSVEDKAPGYRWFNFHETGEFETGVSRALEFSYELDSESTGY